MPVGEIHPRRRKAVQIRSGDLRCRVVDLHVAEPHVIHIQDQDVREAIRLGRVIRRYTGADHGQCRRPSQQPRPSQYTDMCVFQHCFYFWLVIRRKHAHGFFLVYSLAKTSKSHSSCHVMDILPSLKSIGSQMYLPSIGLSGFHISNMAMKAFFKP